MTNTFRSYEDLAREVLINGELREDRTGVGTYSMFGLQYIHDLGNGFPLITSKKVNYKAVVEELLWFLRGESYTTTLKSKIWDEWADPNGWVGPMYGFQWRRKLNEEGIDQIAKVCDLLVDDPYSRRMIVDSWDVDNLDVMVLSPCHALWQCYVRLPKTNNATLDLHLYQRSADLALGVPFNIASYATLLTLLARYAGMTPGKLMISYGDVHVYKTHRNDLWDQTRRVYLNPKPLPELELVDIPADCPRSIESCRGLTADNFVLQGYDPHPAIKFDVAV